MDDKSKEISGITKRLLQTKMQNYPRINTKKKYSNLKYKISREVINGILGIRKPIVYLII